MDDSRIVDFKKTIASFNERSTIDFGCFDYLVTPVGFSWEPGLCFIQAIDTLCLKEPDALILLSFLP